MTNFYETVGGQRFINQVIPSIGRTLEKICVAVKPGDQTAVTYSLIDPPADAINEMLEDGYRIFQAVKLDDSLLVIYEKK